MERIGRNIQAVTKLRSEYEHEQYINDFEKEFAEYNGSGYAIAVNSGTTALELALKAAGVKENDEVILPAYTYISTALAISNLDAVPVFADIKEHTLTLDPKEVEKKLTIRTKAIIPVHVHGNPCEMDGIIRIVEKNNLAIVEDCSHAHGAEYKNKKVGNFGIGCFSCHTTKNFSGIGNSGLIAVNERATYERIKRMLCVENDPDLTLSKRAPCRMDALQAAILKAKLPYLEKVTKKKRSIVAKYRKALPEGIQSQQEEEGSRHVYRDFVVSTENRNELKRHLENAGLETKIRYTTPLHLTQYYKTLPHKRDDLQITQSLFNKLLWLPISYALTDKEVSHVCNTIKCYR